MRLVDADNARECFGGDGVTGAVMKRSQKIIQMAVAIREAASRITVSGPNNWTQLLGIIHTAESIVTEAGKEGEHGG